MYLALSLKKKIKNISEWNKSVRERRTVWSHLHAESKKETKQVTTVISENGEKGLDSPKRWQLSECIRWVHRGSMIIC